MNNLSDIRKQFAKTYGIPGSNCKNSRNRLFLKGFLPIIAFFGIACFIAGMLVTNALVAYFPNFLKYFTLASYFLVILIVITMYELNRFLKKSESDMDSYDTGIEGENAVAMELTFLPGEYAVFHSVNLPDCKWDIDHVVVSHCGIILIETKKWNTPMEYKDGRLVYDRKKYPKDPLDQLKNQAISLKDYLEKIYGLSGKLWIQGALCLVGQELDGIPEFQIDKCYVTNEKRLFDRIVNHGRQGSISDKDLGLIEGRLGELCGK